MTLRITADRIAEIESGQLADHERDLGSVTERLQRAGVDVDALIGEVARFWSWLRRGRSVPADAIRPLPARR